IRVPRSRILRTRSSWRASCRSSGDFSDASASVTEMPGPAGIILVKRSTSPGSTRSVRATSRNAARAFSVPKVMICPTESRPYRSRMYWITSPRRSKQKSRSMSGIEMRSGFRNRSNSRSNLRGSMSVMRQEVALLEIEFAQFRDALGFRHHVRVVREQRAHLPLRLDVALLAEEAEAVGIVQVLARTDGEQHVVGFGVLFP